MLETAGLTTGLTVSPFVRSITERVQVGGSPLPNDQFVTRLDEFLPIVEASESRPTFFELMVAFAFEVFHRRTVDYGVVETGLGGLLDATNVISRRDKLCVISDIGLDHNEVLGETVQEIAAQKAGILQRGNAVLIQGGQPDSVIEVLRDVSLARGASYVEVTSDPQSHAGGRPSPCSKEGTGASPWPR